ncbi:MAG TPA: glycosyltransferase family 1 protein [Kineosporiaceae bacterium]|nr:glycosyltransferase family 1 protein [Kineosporiaceae bacterium]
MTESFLPQINGVTMSVLRICEHLQRRGHQVLVIAPGSGPTTWAGAEVVRVPSLPLPGYGTHRVAWPWPWMTSTLRTFGPDVVHLASPTVLGAQAVTVADRLGVPCVAVYQTDLAAYAARYRAPAASRAVWRWLRWVHAQAARTLAPSRHAVADLQGRGVPRVHLWPRGVDLERFHPLRRDLALRRGLAAEGDLLVGYVGRLAAEKQVELLASVHDLPRVQLVVVGDGPLRPSLQRILPKARFLGLQEGVALAGVFASLDVFVHTGPHETFCQAAQEALASGVPVVAPAAGGLLDLVSDGVNGLLYPAGSAAGLRSAVAELTADGDTRRRMAEASRGTVVGRSWEAVGDAYLTHAREVLAEAAISLSA